MKSTIIGTLPLDPDRLAVEVEHIRQLHMQSTYSEFAFGRWESCVLANRTGDVRDAAIYAYEGPAVSTAHGRDLPYLMSIIEDCFDTTRLKWARLFAVKNGVLISHRDYLELPPGFVRLNVSLATDRTCLHSEEDTVFHMRVGEIWNLHVSAVHSGCSLSEFHRILLVMDFDLKDRPIEGLLDPSVRLREPVEPLLIERPPLESEQLEALHSLSSIVNETNTRDVLQLLSKIHFYRQAGSQSCHDWFCEITRRSGNPRLHEKAVAFRRFCIEERRYGERFEW